MPFTPLFEEVAESQIIEKMMVVIHRDMKAALDHWYEDDNLPDFAAMTEGDQDEFRYPLLVLVVQDGNSEESISGEYLNQELRVGCGLVVSDATVKAVRQKAKKYVRALKAVLRKSVLEVLPASSQYTQYTIAFTWRYFRHGSKESTLTQPAEIVMKLTFGET